MSDLMNQIRETVTTVLDRKDRVEFVPEPFPERGLKELGNLLKAWTWKYEWKDKKRSIFLFRFQSIGEGLLSSDELDELLKGLTADEVKELSAIDPDVRFTLWRKSL